MVEAGLVEPHQEVDVGPRPVLHPGEDHEVAAVAAVEQRGVVVVSQHGDGSGPRLDHAHGGEQQRRQLRVAQRVGAHGETVGIVEDAQRALLARAQEVRLVGHAAQADHEVGPAAAPADRDHEVEQPGSAGSQHLGPLDGEVAPGRDAAEPEPGFGQGAQSLLLVLVLLLLGRHSGTSLSSWARSNQRNP